MPPVPGTAGTRRTARKPARCAESTKENAQPRTVGRQFLVAGAESNYSLQSVWLSGFIFSDFRVTPKVTPRKHLLPPKTKSPARQGMIQIWRIIFRRGVATSGVGPLKGRIQDGVAFHYPTHAPRLPHLRDLASAETRKAFGLRAIWSNFSCKRCFLLTTALLTPWKIRLKGQLHSFGLRFSNDRRRGHISTSTSEDAAEGAKGAKLLSLASSAPSGGFGIRHAFSLLFSGDGLGGELPQERAPLRRAQRNSL